MIIDLFKKEKDIWNYTQFSLILPFNTSSLLGMDQNYKKVYSINFNTDIEFTTSKNIKSLCVQILGFGFYMVKQYGY